MIRTPIIQRLMARVEKRTDGCWIWQGAASSAGYGVIQLPTGKRGGKSASTHRLAYELLKQPIPTDRELDHLCRNTLCLNPDHLEIVTRKENQRRGKNGLLRVPPTHCRRGHLLDATNIRINHRINRTPDKTCLRCEKLRDRHRTTRISRMPQAAISSELLST